jgi:hypothetical protein
MKKQIIQAIVNFWEWIKYWMWQKPISKPEPDKPFILKASEVSKEYMIVTYHGQRINMLKIAYPAWKLSSRKDKRITRDKFEKQEKQGLIKFVEVEGNTICVRNLDYQRRADKIAEGK